MFYVAMPGENSSGREMWQLEGCAEAMSGEFN
jgi:hypothetical protein